MRSALLVSLSLLATGLLAATPIDAAGHPACKPDEAFENENVRIWFHGAKGLVKVFTTNQTSGDTSHFAYSTGSIVELDEGNASLATMNLRRAFPDTSACAIEETDEFVNMTLTVTDDVHARGGSAGEATVVFSYHFNKSSNGAKFDLDVIDWPWQGDASELAFAFDVHADKGTLTPAENGVGWSDESGAPQGYIEWAPNATATYADEHEETSIVDSVTEVDGQKARVELRFTNVTAGYEALKYDPWAGAGAWVVIGPVLVGLAPVEAALSLARSLLG